MGSKFLTTFIWSNLPWNLHWQKLYSTYNHDGVANIIAFLLLVLTFPCFRSITTPSTFVIYSTGWEVNKSNVKTTDAKLWKTLTKTFTMWYKKKKNENNILFIIIFINKFKWDLIIYLIFAMESEKRFYFSIRIEIRGVHVHER